MCDLEIQNEGKTPLGITLGRHAAHDPNAK
jgi:hypothetical protein